MERETRGTLVQFFKILANESRLKILGILARQESSVGELAAYLKLREPTVSHHLAKLKDMDLVDMHPEGTTHLYRLNSEALQAMSKEIFTPERIASLADEMDWEIWEHKVLRSFLEGDRLVRIPATRKKRLVVLRWLVDKFEAGVKYPERTVNEIIKRHHPDSATLRREFIINGLMERKNGVYWRL